MPDCPVVDAHVHLWEPTLFPVSWVDDSDHFDGTYDLSRYDEHSSGVDVDALVFLQVDVALPYALLEPKWVADCAEKDSRLQGIVPWAPVEDGDRLRTYLNALVAVSPLVKGVRQIIQSQPDPDFCIRPDFVRGVQILAEYDLSFDIAIDHLQLKNSIRMVAQCPDVRFILDHIGKPNIKEHFLDPWRQDIKELASFGNVFCKISGMVTEADHENWTPGDLAPYVHHVLDVFGTDRVVFGGDWPVATFATTYPRWVDTLDLLTRDLAPADKRKLWADNARLFYRLSQD